MNSAMINEHQVRNSIIIIVNYHSKEIFSILLLVENQPIVVNRTSKSFFASLLI